MRIFISYCFKFLGIFVFICIGSLFFNFLLVNHFGYQIKKEQNILILGDSHTEFAIDDKIIDKSVNLSHSADSYFYSYLKIRKMKEENPQIDTLLLALSNHNLLVDYDDRWLYNTAHIKSKFRIYTDLMDFSDFMFLFKSNTPAVIQGLIESPKYSIKLLFNGDLKERDLGGFKPSKRNSLARGIEEFRNNYEQRILEYSQAEVKHLFNIIDFCDKNNIELIFISTPLHSEYINRKEKEFQLLKKFYKTNLNQYRLLDYSNFYLADDCFQDISHLNTKGAKIFSQHLMKEIGAN